MFRIKNHLGRKFQEGFFLAVAICQLPTNFWDSEVFNLPKGREVELALTIQPAGLDTPRREKLAEIVIQAKPRNERVLERLCVDLAETRVSRELCWGLKFSPELRMKRARMLTQWNQNNQVLEALKGVSSCEATYLQGLAYRRLRKYADARSWLENAMQICEGDFRKKAFFLKSRLAAMNPSEKNIQVLDDFLKDYPKDSYTDDVLLWKAHALVDLDKTSQAGEVLDQILQEHPQGDMREQALFERAWTFVQSGDLASGLKLLDTLATAQGVYWSGRLRMYPVLDQLKLNPDEKQRQEGEKILKALAEAFPFGYYGYFASQLTKKKSTLKPTRSKLVPSSSLEADPVYKAMSCLKKHGHLEEAVWVVDRLAKNYPSEPERLVLAQRYLELQQPDKAHQLMRNSGLAFPKYGRDLKIFPWSLSFSKPYEKEFQGSDLQMGLCREESGFDKDVISWAGAVGLCQLLPSTAKLKTEELLSPQRNIQAGKEHLDELLTELKHPLKVIAAYNAGPVVKRWSKKHGDVPMDYFVEMIPYEQTRNYVKKVSTAWLSYAWLNGRLKSELYSISPSSY